MEFLPDPNVNILIIAMLLVLREIREWRTKNGKNGKNGLREKLNSLLKDVELFKDSHRNLTHLVAEEHADLNRRFDVESVTIHAKLDRILKECDGR